MKKLSRNFARIFLVILVLGFLGSFFLKSSETNDSYSGEHCSEGSYICTQPGSEPFDRSTEEHKKIDGKGWPFQAIITSDYHIKINVINRVKKTENLSHKTPRISWINLVLNVGIIGLCSLLTTAFIFGSYELIQLILGLYRKNFKH